MQHLHTKFTFGKEQHIVLYEKLNRDSYRVFDLYPFMGMAAFLVISAISALVMITLAAFSVRGYIHIPFDVFFISFAMVLSLCVSIGLLTHWVKDRLYCYPNGIMVTRNNGVVRGIKLNTSADKLEWKLNACLLPFLTCLHLGNYSRGDPYVLRYGDSNEVVSCLYQSLNGNATNTVSFDV